MRNKHGSIKLKIALKNLSRFQIAFLIIVTVIFFFLIFFAASGVRGSDQYWYVADVETILNGGPNVTNNVYPSQIILSDEQIPPKFIHNILNLYLVVPAAKIFGAYWGWIVTNVLSTLITALLIAIVIARITEIWLAITAYSLYLLMPLTIWQTSQPLAEATIALFVIIALLIYIKVNNNKKLWFLLIITISAAYLCRKSFLPLLILVPFVYMIHIRTINVKNIVYLIGLLIFICVVLLANYLLFKQFLINTRASLINSDSNIPGFANNLYQMFTLTRLDSELKNILLKAFENLVHQVLPNDFKSQIFYLPFNLLSILSLSLLFSKRTKIENRILYATIAMMFLHIVIIMVHQNQFRYLLVVTPVIIVSSMLFISGISFLQSKMAQRILMLGLMTLFLIPNLIIVTKLRQDGLQDKELRTGFSIIFDKNIPEDESVIIELPSKFQLIGYALKPRLAVFVTSSYKSEDYQIIRNKTKAKWLLCPLDSPILKHYQVESSAVFDDFPASYEEFGLFRIPR